MYNGIVFTDSQHMKSYPFQSLSLGFILNFFFLISSNFSHDIFTKYILIKKKKSIWNAEWKGVLKCVRSQFLTLLVGCREQIKDLKNAGLSERDSN